MQRFYFSKTPGLIIPHECVALLPFPRKPLSKWGSSEAHLKYLLTLCDRNGVMVDESGHERPVNYAFYANYLYRWGLERAETYVEEFEKAIKSVEAAKEYNLMDSALFGRLLQFEIAWNGTVSAILSEGAFFSLAHILEADADLRCSLDLAQGAYFRQALQVLRNFLEDLFIQLVFCNRQEDFEKWEAGDYRIPRFRGKKGILKELLADGLLHEGNWTLISILAS